MTRNWPICSPEFGSAADLLKVGEHEIGGDLERRLWESDEGVGSSRSVASYWRRGIALRESWSSLWLWMLCRVGERDRSEVGDDWRVPPT